MLEEALRYRYQVLCKMTNYTNLMQDVETSNALQEAKTSSMASPFPLQSHFSLAFPKMTTKSIKVIVTVVKRNGNVTETPHKRKNVYIRGNKYFFVCQKLLLIRKLLTTKSNWRKPI